MIKKVGAEIQKKKDRMASKMTRRMGDEIRPRRMGEEIRTKIS